jgi:AP-1 complex subunit beta-1
MKEVVTDATKG